MIDKDRGKKLKMEGPYVLNKVGRLGGSVVIQDIHTGRKKGRYSCREERWYR